MKLRAISLTNVRRFAGQTATLDGIGDGITVLSEANEFGKSTFFDALQALFFERHRSTARPVKSLKPHSGGAPEVAVEVETAAGRFRIQKRWLNRATARISDTARRVVALDDEAEAWIDALVEGGLSGPSGLLWVRQGLVGLEPEAASATERDRLLAARRDLLSSVAGEIDLMTGGRRMDGVLRRVATELDALATAERLQPRGRWAQALAEAQDLQARETELAAKAAALSGALLARRDAERRLAVLADPEDAAARAADLAAARTAHAFATEHAGQVARAGQEVQLAQLTETGAARDLAALQALAERLALAGVAQREAVARRDAAAATATDLRAADERAARALADATGAATAARDALRLAERARRSAEARVRAADLAGRLARAEEVRQRLEAAVARAAVLRIDPSTVAAAAEAEALRDRLAMQEAAQALTVSFDYAGPLRAELAGVPVETGQVLRLTARTRIDLPGIGVMQVSPGDTGASDLGVQWQAAGAALAEALKRCGAATLAEAQARQSAARESATAATQARDLLDGIAPEGIDRLRAKLAALTAEAETLPPQAADEAQPDTALLEDICRATDAQEAQVRAAAAVAHGASVEAGQALARAQAAEAAAAATFGTASAEAGEAADLAARLETCAAQLAAATAALAQARARLAVLAAAAPDLPTAVARLARAEGAVSAASTEQAELTAAAAEQSGMIRSLSAQGVEEDLELVRERRAVALSRAARFEAEVKALSRLRRALEAARTSARDAYFGPVLEELRPLLAILQDDARIGLDDRTLLPASLTRDGISEDLDVLSGGTREQIAILTRLAFARLFARRGQPVPVILDDALVHSDDDRIEAMFVALHRVAADQQILVFTCRQRAFAGLGGTRATVRIDAKV